MCTQTVSQVGANRQKGQLKAASGPRRGHRRNRTRLGRELRPGGVTCIMAFLLPHLGVRRNVVEAGSTPCGLVLPAADVRRKGLSCDLSKARPFGDLLRTDAVWCRRGSLRWRSLEGSARTGVRLTGDHDRSRGWKWGRGVVRIAGGDRLCVGAAVLQGQIDQGQFGLARFGQRWTDLRVSYGCLLRMCPT